MAVQKPIYPVKCLTTASNAASSRSVVHCSPFVPHVLNGVQLDRPPRKAETGAPYGAKQSGAGRVHLRSIAEERADTSKRQGKETKTALRKWVIFLS